MLLNGSYLLEQHKNTIGIVQAITTRRVALDSHQRVKSSLIYEVQLKCPALEKPQLLQDVGAK